MPCEKCRAFLMDFLPYALDKDIEIYKDYKPQNIQRVLVELVEWLLRIQHKVHLYDFQASKYDAQHYARAHTNPKIREFYISQATYYQMKRRSMILQQESKWMYPILMESGIFKLKKTTCSDELAEKYLSFIVPKVYEYLQELHRAHNCLTTEPLSFFPKMVVEEDEDLYA